MKNKTRTTFLVSLLFASFQATAIEVESAASVILTFRDCVAGEAPCSSFGRAEPRIDEGVPGATEAEASFDEPGKGATAAHAKILELPAVSEHSALAKALPGARNGANSGMFRKYTNDSDQGVTVTLVGTLSYEQTVPEANASYTGPGSGWSGASAELAIFHLDVDVIETGTTKEDLVELMDKGLGELGFVDLGSTGTGPPSNISETTSRDISLSVTMAPGHVVWFWAGVQSIAADGAEVNARFETRVEVEALEENGAP